MRHHPSWRSKSGTFGFCQGLRRRIGASRCDECGTGDTMIAGRSGYVAIDEVADMIAVANA